jgi:hypothetical protein
MKSKEVLKIIEKKIMEGDSKKDIYDELFGKVKFRTDLLQLIAMVPEQELKINYKKQNLLLFCLLVLVSAIKMIVATSILGSISLYMMPLTILVSFISIFFAFMVWNFRGNMYRILGLLGIASLLKSISNFEAWSSYATIDWVLDLILVYIPGFLIVILAYYIGFKVFPYYSFWGMLQEEKLNL